MTRRSRDWEPIEKRDREPMLTSDDLSKFPDPPADARIAYGSDPLQFADLRLPKRPGPHPTAIVVHGGCWRAKYDLKHIGALSDALRSAGLAVWTIEYRRLGDPGGGWPGTFLDVAAAADHLRQMAPRHGLDLDRVVAVGHSAGGQLVLWLGARRRLQTFSPLYRPAPLGLKGVVSLAGVADLARASREEVCGDAARELLGGTPEDVPERYATASPIELLPGDVFQHLLHGAEDSIVPADFSRCFSQAAAEAGGRARCTLLEDAGHFELIAPESSAWPAVEGAVLKLAGGLRDRN